MWQITYPVTNFVGRHRGTLPVILTCPHDAEAQPPGVTPRKRRAGCNFEDARDLHTLVITTGVAQRLLDVTGEAPYVVITEFGRKFIDANRADAATTPNCAYEVPAAKPIYDEYHNTVRDFISEIRAENGGLGLLFDIHGTTEQSADVFIGTDTGNTIDRVLRVDPQAMFRPRSLRSFLIAAGYTLSPTPPSLAVLPKLNGGHTVQTYGSSHAGGLDAFQLEIAPRLRTDVPNSDAREAFIEHLARAVGSLVTLYADTHTLAAFQSINALRR